MQREQVTVHLTKKDVHGKSQRQKTKGRSRTHQSDPLNPIGQIGTGSMVLDESVVLWCVWCHPDPQAVQHDAYDFGEYFWTIRGNLTLFPSNTHLLFGLFVLVEYLQCPIYNASNVRRGCGGHVALWRDYVM